MPALPRSAWFFPALLAAAFVLTASLHAAALSKRIEKDTITVAAEGLSPTERFALVFSRQAAGIVGWYDLASDPQTAVNLCERGGTNGSALFQNRAEAFVGGKEVAIFPGPASRFSVDESSDVRVVILMEGQFTTPSGEFGDEKIRQEVLSYTGSDWKVPERPRYSTRFTVYPSGRIYIRHIIEVRGLPLVLATNRMILSTAPVADVVALNDYPDPRETFLRPASFILHHGRSPGFRASALLVVNFRKYPTDWLGNLLAENGGRRGWLRSAFDVQGGRRLLQPGKYVWNFMLQVEPAGVNTREAAALYALDFLDPARLRFVNSQGAPDLNEMEDDQLDGFAESRGAYVLSAVGRGYVALQMDCGMQGRYCPAFEVHDWRGPIPRFITLDGKRRNIDAHYNAHLENATLIMQYLGILSPGVHTLEVGEFVGAREIQPGTGLVPLR
jgi:hypothetical protein